MFIQRINKEPHSIVFDKLIETFGEPLCYIYPKIAQWEFSYSLNCERSVTLYYFDGTENFGKCAIFLDEKSDVLFIKFENTDGKEEILKLDFNEILNKDIELLFDELIKKQEEPKTNFLTRERIRAGRQMLLRGDIDFPQEDVIDQPNELIDVDQIEQEHLSILHDGPNWLNDDDK